MLKARGGVAPGSFLGCALATGPDDLPLRGVRECKMVTIVRMRQGV